MNRPLLFALAVSLAVVGAAPAAKPPLPVAGPLPKPAPVGDRKGPVIALLDDRAELLIPHLTNDLDVASRSATIAPEELDVFAGASALRVGPEQRFRQEIPGWAFPVREAPQPGEFRFLRFAWKKVGGASVMLQLSNAEGNKTWNDNRYFAGNQHFPWPATRVAEMVPTEWAVVTRDLFNDFGTMTVTGIAFTTTDGTCGLFDHVLLGRTVADVDAATDGALGKVKPKEPLAGKARDAAWEGLGVRNGERAGPAVRAFLASAPDQVRFIRARLGAEQAPVADPKDVRVRIARLVAQLGHDDFDTRVRAEDELAEIGAVAGEEIRRAARAPDPEVAYRGRRLVARLKLTGSESTAPLAAVRAARVVRVLERAGNAEARTVLAEMSGGDFGPYFAAAAKPVLERLTEK